MRAGRALAGTDLELVGALGHGGMGTVWEARERSTGRRVAVKLLGRAERPEQLERFRREGQVAAGLQHPGIVRVHSAGESELGPYLVYELVGGARPLDEVLPGLPRRRAVELVRDAARALGHAHRRGVVHRDVKPGNLLVDGEGRVRVTDFGVASMRGASRLTRTGALVGTPTHMAPEQLRGRDDIGPWTDVWGLGVVLYQALTGEPPFLGETLPQLAAAICEGQPIPPRELQPELPEALEAVCLRALRRRGRERYPDGEALAEDLERVLRDEAPRALRTGGARRGLLLALAGAGLGLVGLALALAPGGGDAAREQPPSASAGSTSPPTTSAGPAAVASPAAPVDAGPLALLPSPWPPAEGPGSALEHARATTGPEVAGLNPADQVFLEEALQGDDEAMINLARTYQRGVRVPRNPTRALHWLFLAAAADNAAALLDLGDRYQTGDGVPLDLLRAARAWERSARRGHPAAAYRWGLAQAEGNGVPRDPAGALLALEAALADRGSEGKNWRASAMTAIALLLEERAGPGDLERAAALVDEVQLDVERGSAYGADWALLEYLARTGRGDVEERRARARVLLRAWQLAHPVRLTREVPRFRVVLDFLGED